MSKLPPDLDRTHELTARYALAATLRGDYEVAERLLALDALAGYAGPPQECTVGSYPVPVVGAAATYPIQFVLPGGGEWWLTRMAIEHPEDIWVSMMVGTNMVLGIPRYGVPASLLTTQFPLVHVAPGRYVLVTLHNHADVSRRPGCVVLTGWGLNFH